MFQRRLNELRLIDLKNFLSHRGLDKTGNKKVLTDRLSKAMIEDGLNTEEYLFDISNIDKTDLGENILCDESSEKIIIAENGDNSDDIKDTNDMEYEIDLIQKDEDFPNENSMDSLTVLHHNDSLINQGKGVSINIIKHDQEVETIVFKTNQDIKAISTEQIKEINKKAVIHGEEVKAGNDTLIITVEDNQNDFDFHKDYCSNPISDILTRPTTSPPQSEVKKELTSGSKRKMATSKPVKSNQAKSSSVKRRDDGKKETISKSFQNVWVSGLAPDTKAAQLKDLFAQNGKVIAAKVVTTANSPGSKCFGFVTMATLEDARNCLEKLDKTELNGQVISIDLAKSEQASPTPFKSKTDKRSTDKRSIASTSVRNHRNKPTLTWSIKGKEIRVLGSGEKKSELKIETRTVEGKRKSEPREIKKVHENGHKGKEESKLSKPNFRSNALNRSKVYSHNLVAKQRALNMRQRQEAWKVTKESGDYKERLARSYLPPPLHHNESSDKTSSGLRYSILGNKMGNVREQQSLGIYGGSTGTMSKRPELGRDRRPNYSFTPSFRPLVRSGGYRGSTRSRPYSFYTNRGTRGGPTSYRGRRAQGTWRGGDSTFSSSRGNTSYLNKGSYIRSRYSDNSNGYRRGPISSMSTQRTYRPTNDFRNPERSTQGIITGRPRTPQHPDHSLENRFDHRRSGRNSSGNAVRSLISKVSPPRPSFFSRGSSNLGPSSANYQRAREPTTGRQTGDNFLYNKRPTMSRGPPSPPPRIQTPPVYRRIGYGTQNILHQQRPGTGGPGVHNESRRFDGRGSFHNRQAPGNSNERSLRESPLGSGRYSHSFPQRSNRTGLKSSAVPLAFPSIDQGMRRVRARPQSPPPPQATFTRYGNNVSNTISKTIYNPTAQRHYSPNRHDSRRSPKPVSAYFRDDRRTTTTMGPPPVVNNRFLSGHKTLQQHQSHQPPRRLPVDYTGDQRPLHRSHEGSASGIKKRKGLESPPPTHYRGSGGESFKRPRTSPPPLSTHRNSRGMATSLLGKPVRVNEYPSAHNPSPYYTTSQRRSPPSGSNNSLGSLILGSGSYRRGHNNSSSAHGPSRHVQSFGPQGSGHSLNRGYGSQSQMGRSSNMVSNSPAPRRGGRNVVNTPQQPPYHYKRY